MAFEMDDVIFSLKQLSNNTENTKTKTTTINNMNTIVTHHLLYLTLSIVTTIWVASTLHRHGRVFLVDAFHGNEKLADSVNHLLVVGFYLINVGFVVFAVKYGDKPTDFATMLESLGTKVGCVLLILGVMHFLNIYVFNNLRKNAVIRHAPPPVAPDAHIARP